MLPKGIRTFNKYVTNRVLRVFTLLPFGPFGVIHHAGRRSQKPYETVLMVWSFEQGFVIALTYGNDVDWLRNIRAAGGCAIYWHRNLYKCGPPEALETSKGMLALPGFARAILQMQGVRDFVWMKILNTDD
ncbi:MAG TPA: nitroreductase family deazaflavin-dependent oxidoreductase [Chloroflexia bacterium]|nr:nitroreductase family deazaflavin-dependent oxidoreductase [Chloroflexia bacterium]